MSLHSVSVGVSTISSSLSFLTGSFTSHVSYHSSQSRPSDASMHAESAQGERPQPVLLSPDAFTGPRSVTWHDTSHVCWCDRKECLWKEKSLSHFVVLGRMCFSGEISACFEIGANKQLNLSVRLSLLELQENGGGRPGRRRW